MNLDLLQCHHQSNVSRINSSLEEKKKGEECGHFLDPTQSHLEPNENPNPPLAFGWAAPKLKPDIVAECVFFSSFPNDKRIFLIWPVPRIVPLTRQCPACLKHDNKCEWMHSCRFWRVSGDSQQQREDIFIIIIMWIDLIQLINWRNSFKSLPETWSEVTMRCIDGFSLRFFSSSLAAQDGRSGTGDNAGSMIDLAN